jgi:peptidoglycan/xylan/chitin deacetylase (PgdA/CDA1 family)
MHQLGKIVTYHELMDFRVETDRPMFCVTFDDGWKDNYTNALPILERSHVPAVVFLATGVLEKGELIWPEDLMLKTRNACEAVAETEIVSKIALLAPDASNCNPREQLERAIEALKLVSTEERQTRIASYFKAIGAQQQALSGHMMTWAEVKEMRGRGVKFGSHSHTHRIFSMASRREIETELEISKAEIRFHLGEYPDAFAFPNARYSGNEGELLERAGYSFGFRLHNLPVTSEANRYFIPRFICSEATARVPGLMKLRLLEFPIF